MSCWHRYVPDMDDGEEFCIRCGDCPAERAREEQANREEENSMKIEANLQLSMGAKRRADRLQEGEYVLWSGLLGEVKSAEFTGHYNALKLTLIVRDGIHVEERTTTVQRFAEFATITAKFV